MYQFTLTDYKWNWVDDGLLPYALAAMRALWVWLLVHLFSLSLMPYRSDLIPLPWVFGLLAMSTALTQVGVYVIKSNWRAILLIALGGLGAVALTLYIGLGSGRPAIGDLGWFSRLLQDQEASISTLVVAVWLWWWGIRAGRERVYYDALVNDFAWGALMLAFAGATAYATRLGALRVAVFTLSSFFAIGLGALAIANLQSTRRFEGSRTEQTVAFNRYWLGTVGVVIGALLLAGLILSQLFAPDIMMWILAKPAAVLGWLVHLLVFAWVLATYPLFLLLEWLASIVRQQIDPTEQPSTPSLPSFADQFEGLEQSQPTAVSPELYVALQGLAGVLLVALVALIFALAFRRFRTLLEEDVEETRESILSLDLLREQLAQLFGRKKKGDGVEPEPFVSIAGDEPRAQVRRVYQALLAWAAARNMPRPPGLTPSEYSLWLGDTLLNHREPIAAITRIYQQARYSTAPILPTHVEEASRAWALIAEADLGES
ncbi:MAG: DUF4129 domain-containing protein [Thermoflexales bacterium]|nr:DUF4129 domain-containing protein [Thermoflexales bacterium]